MLHTALFTARVCRLCAVETPCGDGKGDG
jgi:hypothetical protein